MLNTHSKRVILDARGIVKSYEMVHGKVLALNGVSIQVKQGESVALMGPSGSGKSTLMHLLGCLDKPNEGYYSLNGCDVLALDDHSLSLMRATQIGFVFQSYNLVPQLNVLENVELPFLYRQRQQGIREKVVESINRVGLSHRITHRPNELSGGEMQRVAIARALAIDPVLILADEPTGNLDFDTGKSILCLFQELQRQGATVMIVTHDEMVAGHCQRIMRMRDGKIIDHGCET